MNSGLAGCLIVLPRRWRAFVFHLKNWELRDLANQQPDGCRHGNPERRGCEDDNDDRDINSVNGAFYLGRALGIIHHRNDPSTDYPVKLTMFFSHFNAEGTAATQQNGCTFFGLLGAALCRSEAISPTERKANIKPGPRLIAALCPRKSPQTQHLVWG
jgi:hypothetical protein